MSKPQLWLTQALQCQAQSNNFEARQDNVYGNIQSPKDRGNAKLKLS